MREIHTQLIREEITKQLELYTERSADMVITQSELERLARLMGIDPQVLVVDRQNNIYVSLPDAIEIMDLSRERVRGLIWEGRLESTRPGGRDLFVSLRSVMGYTRRKPPGRPRGS